MNNDNKLASDLVKAAEHHNLDFNQITKAQLESFDSNGRNLAHHCCKYQDGLETLKQLHEKGIKLDESDCQKMTPIMYSCNCQDVETFKYLISNGVNLYAVDINGDTILHQVLKLYKEAISRSLLGTDLISEEIKKKIINRTRLSNNENQLWIDAQKKQQATHIENAKAIINILLNKNHKLLEQTNNKGETPLFCAVDNNSPLVAFLIQEHAANVDFKKKITPIDIMVCLRGKTLRYTEESLLSIANYENAKLLLEKNPKLTEIEENPYYLLRRAFMRNHKLATLLMQHGIILKPNQKELIMHRKSWQKVNVESCKLLALYGYGPRYVDMYQFGKVKIFLECGIEIYSKYEFFRYFGPYAMEAFDICIAMEFFLTLSDIDKKDENVEYFFEKIAELNEDKKKELKMTIPLQWAKIHLLHDFKLMIREENILVKKMRENYLELKLTETKLQLIDDDKRTEEEKRQLSECQGNIRYMELSLVPYCHDRIKKSNDKYLLQSANTKEEKWLDLSLLTKEELLNEMMKIYNIKYQEVLEKKENPLEEKLYLEEDIWEYCRKTKMMTTKLMNNDEGVRKDIYLQFLLHLNEDFDDDLLSDAIGLLLPEKYSREDKEYNKDIFSPSFRKDFLDKRLKIVNEHVESEELKRNKNTLYRTPETKKINKMANVIRE